MMELDTKSDLVASKPYMPGKNESPAFDIPIDTVETIVSVTRENWPNLGPEIHVVELRQAFSFDGGVTWEDGGAATFAGNHIDRFGNLVSECSVKLSGLPQPKSSLRKIKVEVNPVQQLSTKIRLEPRSKVTTMVTKMQIRKRK